MIGMDSADKRRRVLVAGVGNVLHGDDGFGVIVAQRLALHPALPVSVRVLEVGIGGISLVQELFDGYDVLIIVDAVERKCVPGTLYLLEQVPDLTLWSPEQRQEFLADMHMATPSRTLILAKALGILPVAVYLFGCQPTSYDDLVIGLSAPVEQAAERSIERLLSELQQLTTPTNMDVGAD